MRHLIKGGVYFKIIFLMTTITADHLQILFKRETCLTTAAFNRVNPVYPEFYGFHQFHFFAQKVTTRDVSVSKHLWVTSAVE